MSHPESTLYSVGPSICFPQCPHPSVHTGRGDPAGTLTEYALLASRLPQPPIHVFLRPAI